jgi:CO/xanthine dehydrogenase FAD-binding subunit
MATPAVRERATIGGNLCNASPSADTAPPLIVYGAKVVLQKNDDIREIKLEDFFVGPGKSCLNNGELLTSVLLPPSAEHSGAAYVKHARTSKDLALLGVAVCLEMEGKVCRNCRIALGAVGATPLRVKKAEEVLEGKELSPEIIETAVKEAAAEARPIDDQRASADYRRDMVLEITRRAIQAALARIV